MRSGGIPLFAIEDQPEGRVGDGYGAEQEEDHIRDNADPLQGVEGATHEESEAPGMPVPVGEHIPELDDASREKIQYDH